MFNRVPDKFWNQGLTGSKIATSWFPMRLKIERWQPEFQGYFPYFAITSLWIQGISVELLSEHGRECKLYVPKIRAEWTLCRYKQNKNLIALPCPLLLFLQLLLNSQVEAWMNKTWKLSNIATLVQTFYWATPYFNYPQSWPSISWNLDLHVNTIIRFF